ncbi:MAG: DUF1294 domain-containing protein [Bacteroidales bacterium]|nr:DUF1294 domain-containing protein [Bacteroidales bacterium]
MKYSIVYLIIINVIAFFAYGIDKIKAKKGRWRTPESVLLLLAFMGGAAGALAGMLLFRHKTQHKKFTILVPMMLVVWCVVILLWMKYEM